jgi:hypothetical protein
LLLWGGSTLECPKCRHFISGQKNFGDGVGEKLKETQEKVIERMPNLFSVNENANKKK